MAFVFWVRRLAKLSDFNQGVSLASHGYRGRARLTLSSSWLDSSDFDVRSIFLCRLQALPPGSFLMCRDAWQGVSRR